MATSTSISSSSSSSSVIANKNTAKTCFLKTNHHQSSSFIHHQLSLKTVFNNTKISTPWGRRRRSIDPYVVSDSENSQTCHDPDSVLGIIVGGGPRTVTPSKNRRIPSMPLRPAPRLVDILISNCLNSNISKLYLLTHYKSASLNRRLSHAYATYNNTLLNKIEGFIELLPAQLSPENPNWFQGTADALRQYSWLFEKHNVKEYLILACDYLHRMDYEDFIQAHRETNADITVAALPMDEQCATPFGLMKIDEDGRIIEFAEKTKGEQLKAMKVDATLLGLDDKRAKEMPYIANTGIYVVSKDVMLSLLRDKFPGANEFETEVLPGAASIGLKVQAYLYDGYWEHAHSHIERAIINKSVAHIGDNVS